MQTYHGSCHCGAVTFEVDTDLAHLDECNCSICAKKGAVHHNVAADRFRLLSGEKNLQRYQFNKKIAQHFFCTTCGIHPFSHPRNAPKMYNINIRCLDDFDVMAPDVELALFDGKNWEAAFAAMQESGKGDQ